MKLDKKFTAELVKNPGKGGWTCVRWPDSVEFFGTRGLVRCVGRSTAIRSRARSWRSANGTHMLPVKADVRRAIGEEAGEPVAVRLGERLN